ncbi:1,2-epoxyphenylacetyl-CoA isomerase [Mycobacterium sp. THAF192]|nr:1,2-epoxyphenylacetyl-CoA isomerase [Mycobacterium sp. THAF192]
MTNGSPAVHDPATEQIYAGSRVSIRLNSSTQVAELWLQRTDRHNAIDAEFVDQLDIAVSALKHEARQARALVIMASGPNFTVGGDMTHFYQHLDRLADELSGMVGTFHDTMVTLAHLPLPVVCAVQGAVAGGGLGFLWASDIVIAADDMRLVTAFSRLGVSGDGGSSWYLPRIVGLRRALQLSLESPLIGADEAFQYGLVTRLVSATELIEESRRTARKLASGPTSSLGLQRSLIRRSVETDLRGGMDAELHAMRITGTTADAREGMAAFVEQRPAVFCGR